MLTNALSIVLAIVPAGQVNHIIGNAYRHPGSYILVQSCAPPRRTGRSDFAPLVPRPLRGNIAPRFASRQPIRRLAG
ncbi:hypothetical protein BU26DRAFT_515075 [Trematosphaeria pertusa]|uniref:Uncharacterized protein n=1 Tax=Trematosphaeria pertusa TaxID=390896 RepID=A0A6A6IZ69_9PLEO|nr:uncharacterized protein BU26DRAFT_515075 [Trematosphaeria pertusa]KAF2255357.1 hypothetical protein BU26DRAFT_515075 [Trematosphaeria pertusa]